MARSLPFLPRWRQRLAAYRWRRVGWLAGTSLGLGLGLVLYLFGLNDHFFGRLFSAFFVWFWLLLVTFLAVIPFIGWATRHWFGRDWAGEAAPVVRRVAPPATRSVVPATRPRRSPSSL